MCDIRKHTLSVLVLMVAMVALIGSPVFAENVDPSNDGSQYAWGENVGWLNAEPNGDGAVGIMVESDQLSGWMWGENIGWCSLSCVNTSSCATVDYGVLNDGNGILTGVAWCENAGWMNFAPTVGGGVTIDPTTGEFSGNAWGENIGWVSFATMGGSVNYGVTTAWTAVAALVCDFDGDNDCDRDDLDILLAKRNQPANVDFRLDLDGDGMITALDGRILVTQCTRPRCATS